MSFPDPCPHLQGFEVRLFFISSFFQNHSFHLAKVKRRPLVSSPLELLRGGDGLAATALPSSAPQTGRPFVCQCPLPQTGRAT